MTEIWKDIEESDIYQLSSIGRMRNKNTMYILTIPNNGYNMYINKTYETHKTQCRSILIKKYFPLIQKLSNEENSIWKNIIGFSIYQISSTGQIKNIIKDRIVSTQMSGNYLTAMLYVKRGDLRRKKVSVHRLVADAFMPNNNVPKYIVRHKNGNKLDNRVGNLEWALYNTAPTPTQHPHMQISNIINA